MLSADMEEHPETEESEPTKGQIVASLGLFLAGLLLTVAVIHAAIRNPLRLYAAIRSEKLAILDQWQGRAVSAAFGSSHMHNGFDPRAFDAALAGTPLATHSINGGVAGGSQGEQRAMALEFLSKLHPPTAQDRACFVLLEITAGANFTNDHLVHPRAINVYDWDTMRFISHLIDAGMSRQQRVGRVGYAVAAMTMHYLNVGMVSNLIFPPPLDDDILARETEFDRRGLEAAKMTPVMEDNVAKDFARYAAKEEPVPEPILPGNGELLRELDQASPVRNVQMLYVVMPMIEDMGQRRLYPESMDGPHGMVPIMNLARPDLYPELFMPKYWADEAHLNEAGASLASRLLAEQIKAWYAGNPAAARCGG